VEPSSLSIAMNDFEMMQFFFEIHQGLPREGPGGFSSTRRALSLLGDLPQRPRILDIGCGPGMQTLHLAQLTKGQIVAVDNHPPYLDQLSQRAAELGIAERIRVLNDDMFALDFDGAPFDLIWAEGSAYIMEFRNALQSWRRFLKQGGYLAVTEISWLRAAPRDELTVFWEREYPEIKNISQNGRVCRDSGYDLLSHFVLPESAWWDDY